MSVCRAAARVIARVPDGNGGFGGCGVLRPETDFRGATEWSLLRLTGRSAGRPTGQSGDLALSARLPIPHSDLDVVVAVPVYFGHAEPLIEGMGALVDREYIEGQDLPLLRGRVDERADEPGANAVALVNGTDLDAGEIDFAGPALDVKHANVFPASGDDLPRSGLNARAWKSRWVCSSHPQIAVTYAPMAALCSW